MSFLEKLEYGATLVILGTWVWLVCTIVRAACER